jgi:hypothetical protein
LNVKDQTGTHLDLEDTTSDAINCHPHPNVGREHVSHQEKSKQIAVSLLKRERQMMYA